jgi:hypothetical protein
MLMKKTIKITALAVLAALVAFSCIVFSCEPEPKLTGVEWKDYNSRYDAGKNFNNNDVNMSTNMNGIINGFVVTENRLATGANEDNEVTITFPNRSDFLRAAGNAKTESGMKQFLSFHHFKKLDAPVAGKADTLEPAALDYKLVRRNNNVITVALTKKFVIDDSTVIMKINGTKYTFSNGNKLDLIGRGRSGQAGYDDIYFELPVYTVSGPSGFTGPAWAGGTGVRGNLNRSWILTLETISGVPSGEIEESEYRVARLLLAGVTGTTEEIPAITKKIAEDLKGGLKIQEFVNGAWGNVNATINFTIDETTPLAAIFYASHTLKDLVPVRVMWERAAPVTTTDEYFGVKQHIAIRGINTYSASSPTWNPAVFRTAKVYGATGRWYDTYGNRRFNAPAPTLLNVERDFYAKNAVFELYFDSVEFLVDPEEDEGPTTYWVKNFNSDKQKFKDNFKIAYYNGGSPTYASGVTGTGFTYATNVRYVTIRDLEFFTHNPDKEEGVGINAVRLTLDPAYEDINKLYLYISPEIRYTDDKTTFGDASNYLHGFFKAYELAGHTPAGPSAPYPLLRENVWTTGNFSSSTDLTWYCFPVTQGTVYRVWWDDSYGSSGTKTADIQVSAQYEGLTTWIFQSVDSGWNPPQQFTANRDGYVLVRVNVYTSYSSGGTYGIVFTANNATRPAL